MASLRLLLACIWHTTRWRFTLLLLLGVVDGALAPVLTLLSGHLIELATTNEPTVDRLLPGTVAIGVLFCLTLAIVPLRDAVANDVGSRVAHRLAGQVMDATLTPPGIAHLEDPRIADEIRRGADIEWDLAPMSRIVTVLGQSCTLAVRGIGSAVLLAGFAWWAPVVLVAATAVTHLTMGNDEERQIREREEHAVLDRRADYYHDLSLDPPAAKEIRIFGLAGFVGARTRHYRLEFFSHLWRVRAVRRGPVLWSLAAIGVAHALVLGVLARSAFDGAVSTGALAVYVQAIGGITALGYGLLETWWIRQGAAALPHLQQLSTITEPAGALEDTGIRVVPRECIRFEGVGFHYPGTEREILQDLDLELPIGTSLGIVGLNGAGKTTLLKLLARLYDPTSGRITVDGQDLRRCAPAGWRRQLAVISQDFVRYEASALDNIAYGRPLDAVVQGAAELAGAAGLIEDLPRGWETVLSRQYRGGTDLSGGQWQRIALARALYAARTGAGILVLDEPSANLDVRAEAELFDRFLDLTAGLTTVLVTHRLSTVRRTDRIVVIEGGRVLQAGSHEELMAQPGPYVQLFTLQAERFAHD